MSNTTTLDRLKEYIDFKGLSIRQFEISVEMSNGSFASQLKRNGTIGVDRLEKILHVYPDVNPIWLLKGTGEMLLSSEPPATCGNRRTSSPDISHSAAPAPVLDALTKEKIGRLEDKIKLMERENALLREMVDVLKLGRS